MSLNLLIFWIHATKNGVCLGEENPEGGVQFVGRERVAFLNHGKVLSPEAQGGVIHPTDEEDEEEDSGADAEEAPVGRLDATESGVGVKSPTDIWPNQECQCGTPEGHRDKCLTLLDPPVLTHEQLLHHNPAPVALLSPLRVCVIAGLASTARR